MVEITRRNAVRTGAGAGATLLVSGGMLIRSTESAIAASGLTAGDVSVSSDDGSLTTLTITPNITVSWDGQDSQVTEIQATWKVMTSGTSETTIRQTPYSISVSSETTSGSIDHTFPEISLLSNNGGALSASNFFATTDGDSKSTNVTLSMDVVLKDSGGNTVDSATDVLGPTEYTVTVKKHDIRFGPESECERKRHGEHERDMR
jgi:hypothetical protein